jgi:hypothetical protein
MFKNVCFYKEKESKFQRIHFFHSLIFHSKLDQKSPIQALSKACNHFLLRQKRYFSVKNWFLRWVELSIFDIDETNFKNYWFTSIEIKQIFQRSKIWEQKVNWMNFLKNKSILIILMDSFFKKGVFYFINFSTLER